MDEVNEFISVLNAECEVLKKNGVMPISVDEPWRFYSSPLDDEHEYESLRSVLEAGKFIIQAESYVKSGNEAGAWCALAKAQQALLRSLSAKGRLQAKKIGQSRGGQSYDANIKYKIFCIAEDLMLSGESKRALAGQISKELKKEGLTMEDEAIRKTLKKLKHVLVDR